MANSSFSKTDLANLALTHIGEKLISDITSDQSIEASIASVFIDNVMCSEIENFDWSFARKTAALSASSTRTTDVAGTGFGSSYSLPNDLLVVRAIFPDDDYAESVQEKVPYLVISKGSSKVLLTDASSPRLRYTFNQTSLPQFSQNLVMACGHRLAGMIAYARTKKQDLRDVQFRQADVYRALAQQADMMSGESPVPTHSVPNPLLNLGQAPEQQ